MTAHEPGGLAQLAAEALTAYREGDASAMGPLVERLTPVLWRVARGQGLDAATAEDVVQTAWVRLVQSADRIDDPLATLKWLLTTVRREAWVESRRVSRVEPTETEQFDRPLMAIAPEDHVLASERSRTIWRHLRTLSARCQQLLAVIALGDRPDYAQLSQALGMPIGSIGPTRGRCLAKLRLALEADPAWGMVS